MTEYLTGEQIRERREATTATRLEQLAAAARDGEADRLVAQQPRRCPGCGAWVAPDRDCTFPYCRAVS